MKFSRAIILRRARLIVLAWASASLFFTAVLIVSGFGHKPLGYALYANALHFALWTFAVPILFGFTRAFSIRHGKISNIAVIVLVVAVTATAVTLSLWRIVFSTYFPYRSDYPSLGS